MASPDGTSLWSGRKFGNLSNGQAAGCLTLPNNVRLHNRPGQLLDRFLTARKTAAASTAQFISSVVDLLGFDLATPDHSTLSRRNKPLEGPPLRRSGTGPVDLLVDSPGLKLCGAGKWLVERYGISRRRSWRKLLHLGIEMTRFLCLSLRLAVRVPAAGSRFPGSVLEAGYSGACSP